MAFSKVLIDTNICLDAIQKRRPFVEMAAKILDRSEKNEFRGFVSAHSFDTLFYILTQVYSKKTTYEAIEGLRRTVDIAEVSQTVIDRALKMKWDDFEDAIHYQAAHAAGCQAIVTRNGEDFEQAKLPVLSPHQLLEQLGH